ncbi:MAG: hypothetical protein A2579_05975 [Lysobacterales bacterium RIFOXYD1_FULL_69_11]|nr:MAG: hypothetical protein A2190_12075 [Xanthomonadales bacterium RIFOXYA1_FULL_69_10]OHE87451.1 MAG: hypothetical protein A2579_05975 [Xanthomonadales bacterium RIFOXYD1_FULL_69_11]
MKTPTQSSNCLNCNVENPIDAIPDRLPHMVEYATSAGVSGVNDSAFDRPARRELRGRYSPAMMSLPLFRVHG